MVNYYFVGASFDEYDMTKEFVAQGIWKLGWEGVEDNDSYKKMFRIFEQINPGDRIVIKAAFTRKFNLPFKNPRNKKCSVMTLKALGTVIENLGDGHTLKVNWDKDFEAKDWFFYTIQSTMWKPNLKLYETKELINFVEGESPQDYEWFIEKRNWIEREVNEEEIEEIYKKSDKEIEDKKELKIGLNKILFGPPGTGKTYSIQKFQEELLSGQKVIHSTSYNLDNLTWKDAIFLAFKENQFQDMRIRDFEASPIIKEYSKTK